MNNYNNQYQQGNYNQQYYQPNQNGGFPPQNNNDSIPLWVKILIPTVASVAVLIIILVATGAIRPNNKSAEPIETTVSETTQETTTTTVATSAPPQTSYVPATVQTDATSVVTTIVTMPGTPQYSTGRYKVTKANLLYVRTGPSQTYPTVSFYGLSADAQSQIRKRMGGKTANGLVTGCVCDVTYISANWGKIPSGWICLDYCTKIG